MSNNRSIGTTAAANVDTAAAPFSAAARARSYGPQPCLPPSATYLTRQRSLHGSRKCSRRSGRLPTTYASRYRTPPSAAGLRCQSRPASSLRTPSSGATTRGRRPAIPEAAELRAAEKLGVATVGAMGEPSVGWLDSAEGRTVGSKVARWYPCTGTGIDGAWIWVNAWVSVRLPPM